MVKIIASASVILAHVITYNSFDEVVTVSLDMPLEQAEEKAADVESMGDVWVHAVVEKAKV
jgi:hypothetical protein